MKKNSIPTQLKSAEAAINNALKYAEIKAAVLPYGYTVAKLNGGRGLYAEASAAFDHALALGGDQQVATAEVNSALKIARKVYQDLAKLCRVVFAKQPGTLARLGLNKPMPRPMDDFVVAADTLFNWNEHTQDIKDALEAKTYDSSKVSQERSKIAALNVARQTQKGFMGDAQEAKAAQRTALKELHEWYMEFRKLARLALKDKPQLLEKLGILHRSVKTKAQRGATAKAKVTREKKKALKIGGNEAAA